VIDGLRDGAKMESDGTCLRIPARQQNVLENFTRLCTTNSCASPHPFGVSPPPSTPRGYWFPTHHKHPPPFCGFVNLKRLLDPDSSQGGGRQESRHSHAHIHTHTHTSSRVNARARLSRGYHASILPDSPPQARILRIINTNHD
jgi:hypothetical protein